jgi:hypothetical protein
MKLGRDFGQTLQTQNSSKPSATHAKRSRGFDVMVSTTLLALLVAAIASDNPISGEIGGASADRQSYFASVVDFVLNFSLSIGLTWMLCSPADPLGTTRGQDHEQVSISPSISEHCARRWHAASLTRRGARIVVCTNAPCRRNTRA